MLGLLFADATGSIGNLARLSRQVGQHLINCDLVPNIVRVALCCLKDPSDDFFANRVFRRSDRTSRFLGFTPEIAIPWMSFMPSFNALYYPSWNPPVGYLRAVLLFFDRFEVIIPEGVPAGYLPANQQVFNLIPDAFQERRERHYEIDLHGERWDRFELALDMIVEDQRLPEPTTRHATRPGRKTPKGSQLPLFPEEELSSEDQERQPSLPAFQNCIPQDQSIRIGEGRFDGLHIGGGVLTHDSKMNYMVKDALRRRGLLRPDLQHIAEEAGKAGFHVVDGRASGLILSMLADTLAQRHRLRTITDEPLGYTLNSLNARHPDSRRAVEMSLASTIISTEIPETVGLLTAEQYVELRKRFEDVRIPFQRAVRDLCDDNALSSITDPETLREAIREVAEEYGKAIVQFRSSSFSKNLKAWAPFGIGVLGGALGILDGVTVGAVGLGLTVAVQLYEKRQNAKPGGVPVYRVWIGNSVCIN